MSKKVSVMVNLTFDLYPWVQEDICATFEDILRDGFSAQLSL